MATCCYLWLFMASWVVGFYSVYHPYNIQWLRVKTLILPSLNYHHGTSRTVKTWDRPGGHAWQSGFVMELEPKSAMVNLRAFGDP